MEKIFYYFEVIGLLKMTRLLAEVHQESSRVFEKFNFVTIDRMSDCRCAKFEMK